MIDIATATPDELREAMSLIATRLAQLEQAATTVEQQLKTAAAADLPKLSAAITKQAVLLGDAATAGSIRQIMGTAEDQPGTTSLRALRAQTNANVIAAASIKALIGFVIDLAQRQIDDAQAGRTVARQVLREARLSSGALDSADVGAE